MNDIAISCEGLSKRYRIGERESYKALRDVLTDVAASPFRRLRSAFRNGHSPSGIQDPAASFWALEDVSFEVKRGEVVGIIGRNGAGKSTLLKILGRITKPTRGHAEIRGRVGSLLEVGTGFHPELTGRENIYLSAAILGMRKTEIERKFDEIVAFAEVERFIDTPVKRYSSGMYVRLAFAVAAHMEPEILLVDEVLAVGDAQFQSKCLGKMETVARHGRTVLFVSHNMAAIQSLCSHCLYLSDGKKAFEGEAEPVIKAYLSTVSVDSDRPGLKERVDRRGSGRVKIVDFYVLNKEGVKQDSLNAGGDYTFVIEYEKTNSADAIANVVGSIALTDRQRRIVLLVRSNFMNQNVRLPPGRHGKIECHIDDLSLGLGRYHSILYLSHGESEVLDWVEDATEISIIGGDYFGTGNTGLPSLCKVLTRSHWKAT
jgi:lipopolysaccharide transport system ATP-binding protein